MLSSEVEIPFLCPDAPRKHTGSTEKGGGTVCASDGAGRNELEAASQDLF